MSFLDKLKSGVSDAGTKAKSTVEVNRLKMKNSSKRKEIDQVYMKIGKLVYLSIRGSGLGYNELIKPLVEEVVNLETEIKVNLQQIKTLSDQRDCSCGRIVSFETRFCPNCGNEFKEKLEEH